MPSDTRGNPDEGKRKNRPNVNRPTSAFGPGTLDFVHKAIAPFNPFNHRKKDSARILSGCKIIFYMLSALQIQSPCSGSRHNDTKDGELYSISKDKDICGKLRCL
jgi:hypothetical protein